jgi:hypothetical protein
LQAEGDILNGDERLDRVAAPSVDLVHFAEVFHFDLELVVRCLSYALLLR